MAEGFQVDLSTFWGIYYWCLSNIFWLRRKDKKDLNEKVAEICIYPSSHVEEKSLLGLSTCTVSSSHSLLTNRIVFHLHL